MTDPVAVLDRLIYEKNGFVYMRPCVDITLYWSGSIFERGDDIVAFYRRALEVIGNGLRYFRTETMGSARPLEKDTLSLLPFWLQGTRSRRDIYMISLESGSIPDEPSDRAFRLSATPGRGYIRLILPLSTVSGSVDFYLDLAKELGLATACDFGQAGFATHWNHLGRNTRGVLQRMNFLGNRYPGLDMSHPLCTKFITSKGIKCVNWLTFLSTRYCERLGGIGALRRRFEETVLIHEAKDGAIIQAGPSPGVGDVNRQQDLPIYRQVGKQLAPIRSRDHPPVFGPDGIADLEATHKWLARFDS